MAALDVAGVTSRGCGVFVVGHVASPYDGAAAVIGFLHGHVRHEPVGRRPVPVVLTGLEVHAVAGADLAECVGGWAPGLSVLITTSTRRRLGAISPPPDRFAGQA